MQDIVGEMYAAMSEYKRMCRTRLSQQAVVDTHTANLNYVIATDR